MFFNNILMPPNLTDWETQVYEQWGIHVVCINKTLEIRNFRN